MKTELCPACAKKRKHPQEALVRFLLGKLAMQNNGCALARHELKNNEWQWLGVVKDEQMKVHLEEEEAKRKAGG